MLHRTKHVSGLSPLREKGNHSVALILPQTREISWEMRKECYLVAALKFFVDAQQKAVVVVAAIPLSMIACYTHKGYIIAYDAWEMRHQKAICG